MPQQNPPIEKLKNLYFHHAAKMKQPHSMAEPKKDEVRRLAFSAPSMRQMPRLPPAFNRIQQQGQPDEDERHQRGRIQSFLKQKYAEEERAGWGNVLQQAKRHQAHMPGGIGEHDQRQGCDRPGKKQQKALPNRRAAKKTLPIPVEMQNPAERKGHQHDCLNEQTGKRLNGNRFSDKAIQCKSESQRQGQPRKLIVAQKTQQDAGTSQQNGYPLKPRRSFTQKKEAEQHVHKGIGVISEARFKDLPGTDGPYVQEPVQTHHAGTGEHGQGHAAVAESTDDLRPAPCQ